MSGHFQREAERQEDERAWLESLPDKLDQADARIAALEAALTDYINQTGIGSTLLPDVVPPESGTMEAENRALREVVDAVEATAEFLPGVGWRIKNADDVAAAMLRFKHMENQNEANQ